MCVGVSRFQGTLCFLHVSFCDSGLSDCWLMDTPPILGCVFPLTGCVFQMASGLDRVAFLDKAHAVVSGLKPSAQPWGVTLSFPTAPALFPWSQVPECWFGTLKHKMTRAFC